MLRSPDLPRVLHVFHPTEVQSSPRLATQQEVARQHQERVIDLDVDWLALSPLGQSRIAKVLADGRLQSAYQDIERLMMTLRMGGEPPVPFAREGTIPSCDWSSAVMMKSLEIGERYTDRTPKLRNSEIGCHDPRLQNFRSTPEYLTCSWKRKEIGELLSKKTTGCALFSHSQRM
jgi:hypothetical protein